MSILQTAKKDFDTPRSPAPPAAGEQERLRVLRATELLDTEPEDDFDRLTRLAARVFKVPIALVSLVDANRQFFKSSCGLPDSLAAERESPLTHSLCQFVVEDEAPLAITDARTDPRYQNSGAVRDWKIVAYLGVPIFDGDNKAVIGSLCVLDTKPRRWTLDDIVVLTDLSQSVMAEIRLRAQIRTARETQAKLNRAVRGSRDGLWEWNVVTDELFVSPQSKAMLGYDDAEVPNTTDGWRNLLYKDDYAPTVVAVQNFVDCCRTSDTELLPDFPLTMGKDTEKNPTDFELEYRMNHKDGSLRWIYSRGYAYRGDNGEVLLMSGSHTDITERKRSEISLQAQTKALKTQSETLKTQAIELEKTRDYAISSARAKSQFLANMSHEIRTPMNGVIGMVSLITETVLTNEQREYLRTIRSSSESLMAIINDVLDLSKIESGNLELEETPFVLRTVVEEASELLMPKIREKGLELACSVSPSLPPVFRGDPGRLRQILLNIGMNAAKFTETGHIEIAVLADAKAANERDDVIALRFVIADTGIGISPDRQTAIFDSFTQADVATTRQYGGTGLGLSISRQLAQRMGGDISLASTVGTGSTFTVDVPLFVETNEDTAAMVIAAQAISSLGTAAKNGARVETLLARKRVLVIDDVPANRRILREQLQAWGAWVEEAQTGMEGVRLLQNGQTTENDPGFSLVLVDMHMPGIDGRTTAQLIKSDAHFAETPIILLSSGGAVRDYQRSVIGASELFAAVISKPVRQADLLTGVLKAMSHAANTTPFVSGSSDAAGAFTHPMLRSDYSPPVMEAGAYRFEREASDSDLLAGVKILLAEDNLVNQKVAMALLAKWGCPPPVAVVNGELALAKVMECAGTDAAFDLVLMDVQMPEMDGLTATTRIRDAEEARGLKPVPIVALTAHAMTGDRERCLASGMSDYVAKPVRPDALKTVLQKWLGLTPTVGSFGETSKGLAPPRELPTFNATRLIESCGDDEEVIAEVLGDFRASVPVLFEEIAAALDTADRKAARFAAHTLKGSSRTVGAESLAYVCEQLEIAATDSNLQAARNTLNLARDEWTRLNDALNALTEEAE